MSNEITNKELYKLVNADTVECLIDGAIIFIEKEEVTVSCRLENDGYYYASIWLNESDEAELTEKQRDYIYRTLSESLAEHKESCSDYLKEDSMDDLRNDAMNANNLNY
jgi:hypothetical protein